MTPVSGPLMTSEGLVVFLILEDGPDRVGASAQTAVPCSLRVMIFNVIVFKLYLIKKDFQYFYQSWYIGHVFGALLYVFPLNKYGFDK